MIKIKSYIQQHPLPCGCETRSLEQDRKNNTDTTFVTIKSSKQPVIFIGSTTESMSLANNAIPSEAKAS